MLVIRIIDDRGRSLNDYDVMFTAGPNYDENHLPPGFFVDRQRNQLNPGKLTYYLDYDVMEQWFNQKRIEDRFGFKIRARPADGFAYYTEAEFRGKFSALRRYLEPNQTMMVQIELQRYVDEGVFQLTQNLEPEDIMREPLGRRIP